MRWKAAMEQALYGPDGFFVREHPADHFRTSAHSPLFAAALAKMVCQVDYDLGQPARLDLVDIGAGGGELLAGILAALPDGVRERTRPIAVEVAPSIRRLSIRRLTARHTVEPAHNFMIDWREERPSEVTGVLLATEWLDNVPLDLARDGHYLNADGSLGDPLERPDAEWVQRWWPDDGGGIIEIGRSRDEAWAAAAGTLRKGLALTVDYGHLAGTRPASPTIAGFANGRDVVPRLDGSTDITAHVALDSAAAATGMPYALRTQAEALRALGIDGARPPLELAHRDPAGYLRALAIASEAAQLTDQHGLGGHWWLSHPVL